jgi:hypothetical protein
MLFGLENMLMFINVFLKGIFFVFLFFLKRLKTIPKSSSIDCESRLMKQKLLVRIKKKKKRLKKKTKGSSATQTPTQRHKQAYSLHRQFFSTYSSAKRMRSPWYLRDSSKSVFRGIHYQWIGGSARKESDRWLF